MVEAIGLKVKVPYSDITSIHNSIQIY